MEKEEIKQTFKELELRREISELKLEIKRKNKMIEKLKQKLEKRK